MIGMLIFKCFSLIQWNREKIELFCHSKWDGTVNLLFYVVANFVKVVVIVSFSLW